MGNPTTPVAEKLVAEVPVTRDAYSAELPAKDGNEYIIVANSREPKATFIHSKTDNADKNYTDFLSLQIENGFVVYADRADNDVPQCAALDTHTAFQVLSAFEAVGASGGVSYKEAESLATLAEVMSKPVIKNHKFEPADIQSIEDAVKKVIEAAGPAPAKAAHAK